MSSSYLNPIAFKLGNFAVHWYGIIMASAVLIGLHFATKEATRKNLDSDLIYDLLIWAIPSAIVGARLYYVIFKWDYYKSNPSQIIAVWQGGLAIHGALIGAIIAGVLFVKRHNLNFWTIADITAPSLILGQALGRWGNFMNQEAHGGPVALSFLESLKLPTFIIEQMQINGTYYHPTFLYESIWNLSIFLFLFFYWKKRKFLKAGDIFLTYISLYSVGRFFIEGMRTDSLMIGPLRMAQVISIVIIIISITMSYYNHKKVKS